MHQKAIVYKSKTSLVAIVLRIHRLYGLYNDLNEKKKIKVYMIEQKGMQLWPTLDDGWDWIHNIRL